MRRLGNLRRWALLGGILAGAAAPAPVIGPAIAAGPGPVAGPAIAAGPGEGEDARAETGWLASRPAARLLASVRPDYARYIATLRPMPAGPFRSPEDAAIYMALVRPGASDPTRGASAPLAGPGARNDILFDPSSVSAGRSTAWAILLLDHEYFHARHLAGETSLPLPTGVAPEVERHYYEAAAWGFNVAEARAGLYAGLRADEFREALDHYGEHYRALRDLSRERDPDRWRSMSDLLARPPALVTSAALAPRRPGDRARPSGRGRAAATP